MNRKTASKKDRYVKFGKPLPVSVKFYESLCKSACEAGNWCQFYSGTLLIDQIDRYLYNGEEPSSMSPNEIRVVFAFIRAEMDRAIERSARAREAAQARRKAMAEAQAEIICETAAAEGCDMDMAETVASNRVVGAERCGKVDSRTVVNSSRECRDFGHVDRILPIDGKTVILDREGDISP